MALIPMTSLATYLTGTMLQIMRATMDLFGQIFRNLWGHKLRSFLTMFGIAWGVGSLLFGGSGRRVPFR